MKQLFDDQSAVSYSIVTILVVIAFMSVFWIGLSEVVNPIAEQFDAAVTDGKITDETQGHFNTAVSIFESTILFGLIGVALWGIRQSKIETSEPSKSMLPLIGSSSIMLVLSFISIILIFALAQPLDQILVAFVNSGLLDSPDITENNNYILLKVFYLACLAPALVGIAIHILTSVEKIDYGFLGGEEQEIEYVDYYQGVE